MQGGVRRKRDLLPRYNGGKKNGGGRNPLNYLTTPMKKILGYLLLLSVAFALIKIAYADLSHTPDFELDHDSGRKVNMDAMQNKEKLGNKQLLKDVDRLMKDEKAMAAAAAGNAPVGSGNKMGDAANAAAAAGEAKLNEKQKKIQEEIKHQQQQQAPADKNNLMKDKSNKIEENAKKQLI